MKLKDEVWQVNTTGANGIGATTDIAMGTSEDGEPAIRIGEHIVTGEQKETKLYSHDIKITSSNYGGELSFALLRTRAGQFNAAADVISEVGKTPTIAQGDFKWGFATFNIAGRVYGDGSKIYVDYYSDTESKWTRILINAADITAVEDHPTEI